MEILKRNLKRLINRNYTLATHWRYRRYLRQVTGLPPLVLFQMGKVGSTSVLHSLRARSPSYDLFHVHVLSHDWIKKVYYHYRYASRVHGHAIVSGHMLSSMYLRGLLDREFDRHEWKIISLVRDPVARNVSAFFELLPTSFPALVKLYHDAALAAEQRVPELIRIFLEKFEEHDTPIYWFEKHLQPVFGVDIYQSPFPTQQGYQILRQDNVSVLIIRLEDLNNSVAPALKEFLGLDNFVLEKRNVSDQKAYSDVYRRFQDQLLLPENYIQRMYDSRYMRHFYTEEEITQFRRRWPCTDTT
jgi:hypothetical protein